MRLRLSACDEVNHGGVRYAVSNSAEGIGVGIVEVPDHVGEVLLRVSAGAVRVDAPPVEEPMHPIRMRWRPGASISWRNTVFTADENGVIVVPAAAVAEAMSHGLTPLPAEA